ncbi:MAG: hypothetical protein OXI38_02045, partial [Bacteroidota bacterium]|nr:hypothetical protein [Bacteroidota bacterium]
MEPVNLTAGFSGSTYPLPGSVSTNICVLDDEASIVAFPDVEGIDVPVAITDEGMEAFDGLPTVQPVANVNVEVGILSRSGTDLMPSPASQTFGNQSMPQPVSAVDEGDDESYTVKLATQPTATVTVAITSSNTDVTTSPTSLTFTTADYNTPQTVMVSADEDDDADNGTATHTASGGDYASETASLALTVDDDEMAGIMLSVSTLGVDEGDDESYTVKLATQPTATVTVAITGHAGTDLTLDQTSLTFTTADWGTAQTVTVTAGEDDDATNDSATLVHTASGGDYAGQTASLMVNTTDDETAGITLSVSTLTVYEGGSSNTYTVKLATQPTAKVSVLLGGQGTDLRDLVVDTAELMFTMGNWNVAQLVTVAAVEDDDATNESATLVHTARG